MAVGRQATGRVLLVEFLSDDRCVHYASEEYPLMQGYLKALDVPVRWVSLPRTAAYQGGPYIIDPPGDHLRALLDAAAEFQPSVLVLNQTPSDRLTATLTAALPQCRQLLIGRDTARYGVLTSDVRSWLESDGGAIAVPTQASPSASETTGDDEAQLSFVAVPDFSSTTLTGAEIKDLPPISLRVGAACLYTKPIDPNPAYQGVDLSDVEQNVGCTFCLDHVMVKFHDKSSADSVDRIANLVQQFFDTAPDDRRDVVFEVGDTQAFPDILDRIAALDLPPSKFHFPRRVDEIMRAETVLRRCLPQFKEQGHHITFLCMGLENFSAAENQRLNKGLSAAQLEDGLLFLHELETTYPEALTFFRNSDSEKFQDDPRGVMMILFTPWTELQDLDTNLQVLERLGERIELMRGIRYQIVSRLLLFPRTAILRLAEHDGLVTEAFPEPVAVAGGVAPTTSGRAVEVPWRFHNAEVARIYRFLIRIMQRKMTPDSTPLPHEESLERGLGIVRELMWGKHTTLLRLFRTLLTVTQEAEAGADDEAILAEFVHRSVADSGLPRGHDLQQREVYPQHPEADFG